MKDAKKFIMTVNVAGLEMPVVTEVEVDESEL